MRSLLVLGVLLVLVLGPFLQAGAGPGSRGNVTILVTTFDGNATELTIVIPDGGGLDHSAAIALQRGLQISDSGFDISLGKSATGEWPTDIHLDVGVDGSDEWAFSGLGYGAFGNQTGFASGAADANVTFPVGGGSNATAEILLPKNATVTKTQIRVTVPGIRIAVVCKQNSKACDVKTSDPAYAAQNLFRAKGWDAPIVQPTDVDTTSELAAYTAVFGGDSGSNDNGLTTYQNALQTWISTNGGGFVGGSWIVCRATAGSALDQVLPVAPGAWCMSSFGGTVNIIDNTHPVTKGVGSFAPAGSRAEYPGTNAADAGASILGRISTNSYPVVVAAPQGNGKVVWLGPMYWADFATYNNAALYTDTDSKNLLTNAVAWVSGSPLSDTSVDLLDDGTIDWSRTQWNGTEMLPDFSAALNAYLAGAEPTLVDEYGNAFVSVPINVTRNRAGYAGLGNLSVEYTFAARVGPRPFGNLTKVLNDQLLDTVSPQIDTLQIAVSAKTGGTFTLSDLRIVAEPPDHAPVLAVATPDVGDLTVDEGTTQPFHAEGTDVYPNPVSYAWQLDGTPVGTDADYVYAPDFESAGKHALVLSLDNGLQTVTRSWAVQVRNVDRPPVIDTRDPDAADVTDVTVPENTSRTFAVTVHDPDGDAVVLTWSLDAKSVITGLATQYAYAPGWLDAGAHRVRVDASDKYGLSASATWNVTVANVNAAPVITGAKPSGTTVTLPENSTMSFSPKIDPVDGDEVTVGWSLDGKEQRPGKDFTLVTGYDDAGTHALVAVASDGTATARRDWTVIVTDVDRAPRATITSPEANAAYRTFDRIPLVAEAGTDPDGDPLTYTWTVGGKVVATGREATIELPKGNQLITLMVDDGREGIDQVSVGVSVQEITFSLDVQAPPDVLVGGSAPITARVTNTGDADASGAVGHWMVDGKDVGDPVTLESAPPGLTVVLNWTFTPDREGIFRIGFRLGSLNRTTSIVASLTPPPPPPRVVPPLTPVESVTAILLAPMGLLLVAAALAGVAVTGMAVGRRNRKRREAAEAERARLPTLQPVTMGAYGPITMAPAFGMYGGRGPQGFLPPAYPALPPDSRPPPSPPPGVISLPTPLTPAPAPSTTAQPTPGWSPLGPPAPADPAGAPVYRPAEGLPVDPDLAVVERIDAEVRDAVQAGRQTGTAQQQMMLARSFQRKGNTAKARYYAERAAGELAR